MFQWFGQPNADLPVRGDGDGQVAERLIRGTVRGDPVAGGVPAISPLRGGQTGVVEVVAGMGETFPAFGHTYPVTAAIFFGLGERTTQVLQPPLLGEPFGLAGIALRLLGFSAGFALRGRQRVGGGGGQAFLDGGDRRPQPDDVAVLGIPGQAALVVVAGDDRVGPPRRGLPGQGFLAGVELIPAHLAAFIATQRRIGLFPLRGRGQIGATQPAEMSGHPIEHELVLGRGAQPRGDRHPRGSRDRFHPTPLPQPAHRHATASTHGRDSRTRVRQLAACPLPTNKTANSSQPER